jgi:uncharacterized radical SAM superfamily Fe-S cluster-containing enzyme
MSQNFEGKILGDTESLCPVCLKRIPARRVAYGNDVYLEKECDLHGPFRVIIWRGAYPEYSTWATLTLPSQPDVCDTVIDKGCPFDCGLCPDHRQHTCCVLLEVTGRCNLQCPICFAQAGSDKADPSLQEIDSWYQKLMDNGGPYNIQLSGGEPTLRDDLPEIIALGRSKGFTFFQVNTNGVRLAADEEYVRNLKDAGLSCIFLQFDGTTDTIYEQIRGRAVLAEKMQAIDRCAALKLGVILVVTVVPGINSGNIGNIIRFALEQQPTVRGVHFQPISYFGRYPQAPVDADRITLPEIIRAIEQQTDGQIKADTLQAPRAENSYCSFQGNYVLMPDGELKALSNHQNEKSCCSPMSAAAGAKSAREFVAKKWAISSTQNSERKITESLCYGVNTDSLDEFLESVEQNSFCLSGMAFQDAWTIDLERLRSCFIHVVSEDARIIPFCAYNLTDITGRSLYRSSVGTCPK